MFSHSKGLKARSKSSPGQRPGSALRHTAEYRSGFQPSSSKANLHPGRCPGLKWHAPSALWFAFTDTLLFTDTPLQTSGPCTQSLPNKSLIEPNLILRQHRPDLSLKVPARMHFVLRVKVGDQLTPVVQPDRERKKLSLPPELLELRALRLDPLLRIELQRGNHAFDARHFAQVKRDVHVIVKHCRAHKHVVRPRQRAMQAFLHALPYVGGHPRPAVLRAEHHMQQHTAQFHAGEYTTPRQERP